MGQRAVFLIGFVCVFLGVIGLYLQLQDPISMTKPDVVSVEEELKIRMVVSNQNLDKGVLVQPEYFRYVYVGESEALAIGIAEDQNIEFNTGMILAKDIKKDEFLGVNYILSPEDDNYINAQLSEGMSPYSLKIPKTNFYGAGINVGDLIDIVVMTSDDENIGGSGNDGRIESFRTLAVSPLITQVKVLNIDSYSETRQELSLTIELSRHDIAKMIIATKIGLVEVFRSSMSVDVSNTTKARTQDVLSDYQSVLEYRGSKK
ncbi:pilus assembly protein CpaB [Marinomonas algicola]|uniref:pilus assembly protein CpaB n=1 Tax=Marinomonas algicola TaxID=2773454 RepID=UPI00174BCA17|nr:pilus assembly protein CpaB [Marinomonas algicola]